jgi:hypothetical protein
VKAAFSAGSLIAVLLNHWLMKRKRSPSSPLQLFSYSAAVMLFTLTTNLGFAPLCLADAGTENSACPKISPVNLSSTASPLHEEIKATTLHQLLKEKKVVLLDLRSTEDFDKGHIKGAISLPLTAKPETLLKKIAPDCKTSIVIYCEAQLAPNSRAVPLTWMGTQQLYALGYNNVRELETLRAPSAQAQPLFPSTPDCTGRKNFNYKGLEFEGADLSFIHQTVFGCRP